MEIESNNVIAIAVFGIFILVLGIFYVFSVVPEKNRLFRVTGDCIHSNNPSKCECEKMGGKLIRVGFGGSCVFPPQ